MGAMREYGSLALRVAVGAALLTQAYIALFVATPQGMAAFIAKLGLPAPTLLALLVILAHGLGGAMMVIGIGTRTAAGANAVILLAGLLAVYVRQGVLLRGGLVDQAAGRAMPAGYEYIAVLIAATLALAAGGGGGGGKSK